MHSVCVFCWYYAYVHLYLNKINLFIYINTLKIIRFLFCFTVSVYFRISDQAARVIGRQLAVIGDELERQWAEREPNWPPAPLHMLRPAHALTRIIYQ